LLLFDLMISDLFNKEENIFVSFWRTFDVDFGNVKLRQPKHEVIEFDIEEEKK